MKLKSTLFLFFVLFLKFLGNTQVVINEINYRSVTPQENIEFIELYNYSENEVDLSCWNLTRGVSYTFPVGVIIQPDSYLVIAGNTETCSSFFKLSKTLGPWHGKLSNTNDNIELRNKEFVIIDKVNYDGWGEWPPVSHEDTKERKQTRKGTVYIPLKIEQSLQKINSIVSGKHPGSWRSGDPTPGLPNSKVLVSNIEKTPIISRISRSEKAPNSNEEVEVQVKLTNIQSVIPSLEVTLEYQIVEPGNYIPKTSSEYNAAENWARINMQSLENNDEVTTFSAVIPKEVQKHRRLIRYRVMVKVKSQFRAYYPDNNHKESNYSYFVNDGQKKFKGISIDSLSALQSIELITSENQTNNYILKGNFDDYRGEGTLIYGDKVYDHINFRARGKNSRHNKVKRNLKFSLNNNRPLVPEDDYGNKYDHPRSKIALSGGWINDCNSHGLTEALIYKIAALTGGFNKHTDFCQLRIIDNAEENGVNGDFWGVYQIMEDWGGTMLAEHGLPDGNIYTYKDWKLSHQGENGPFGENNQEYITWNEQLGDSKDGRATDKRQDVSLNFLIENLDLEHYFADLLLNEITGNGETNYLGQHSYREYFNPVTKKWIAQCGDYDETFGANHDKSSIYPKSESRVWRNMRGLLKKEVLSHDSLKILFANLLRSTSDLLINDQQIRMLLKSEVSPIYKDEYDVNWTDLDYARWSDAEGSKIEYDDYKKDVIDWYYNWFFTRAEHLSNDSLCYNNYKLGEEKKSPTQNIYYLEEVLAPNTPKISFMGEKNYALDELSFNCSGFIDDSGTFEAIEWRAAEWSDPENPIYKINEIPIYEITSTWSSGELSETAVELTLPPTAKLKPGRSYKVRARYKDNTHRWSHWSAPIHITPTAPVHSDTPDLVISEIMFNPSSECDVEYIKITNRGFFSAELTHVKFTEGIIYEFPLGSSLSGKKSLVLTKDSILFVQKYGFSPFGEYKNSLDNKGEKIRLSGAYDNVINKIHYLENDSWTIGEKGHSLQLDNFSKSNQKGKNWKLSAELCGSPSLGNNSILSVILVCAAILTLVILVLSLYLKKRNKDHQNA